MSDQNGANRARWGFRRLGLWAGLALLAAVAVTVFALCACKSSRG